MSTTAELVKTLVSPAIASRLRRKLAVERQRITQARRAFLASARGEPLLRGDAELLAAYFDDYDRNFKDPVVGEELRIAQDLAARISSGRLSTASLNPAQRAIMSRYEELVLRGRSAQQMREKADDDAGLAQMPDDGDGRGPDDGDAPDDGDTLRGLGRLYGLGVPPTETTDESYDTAMTTIAVIGWGLTLGGSAAGAYHGYKRNNSIGWALVWSFMGGLLPVITLSVAAAQGFGKREK